MASQLTGWLTSVPTAGATEASSHGSTDTQMNLPGKHSTTWERTIHKHQQTALSISTWGKQPHHELGHFERLHVAHKGSLGEKSSSATLSCKSSAESVTRRRRALITLKRSLRMVSRFPAMLNGYSRLTRRMAWCSSLGNTGLGKSELLEVFYDC